MKIEYALFFGILSSLYIKPTHITLLAPICTRNMWLFVTRVIKLALKRHWPIIVSYLLFIFLLDENLLIPIIFTHGLILCLSLNIINPFEFIISIGTLLFLDSWVLLLILSLGMIPFRILRYQTASLIKDHSQMLLVLTIITSLYALLPYLSQFMILQLFPINRILMLFVFFFTSNLSQELTNSKEMIGRLKTRFHLVRLKMTNHSMNFLPHEILKTLKHHLLLLGVLSLISFLVYRTPLDHIIVLILCLILIVFEFDMLFYYSFQFKHSYYAFTLIRKGAELGINYLVSTYILMYGLMKGIHQTQSSLSLMYLFVSAIVLIVLLFRWCRALDLTFRLRPLLIISLMLLSSCSKTSGPAEFVISITQSSYFGKLEPVVIKSSNLDEITLRIKESQNVSRGTVLYRDAYGRDVKASMDGRVEIRETVFLFISHAYECKVIIPETDMHNFRLKESYEIESMNGNPLGSIKLKSIDYQYEHNSGSYQDINQYLLIFDIKESKLIPQSVILTVPQPIISIPNSFVLLEEDAIYVETIEGKVAVKGTYNEETQTYDITTRLSDGLILYEVSND